jgi:hypothetical protein
MQVMGGEVRRFPAFYYTHLERFSLKF